MQDSTRTLCRRSAARRSGIDARVSRTREPSMYSPTSYEYAMLKEYFAGKSVWFSPRVRYIVNSRCGSHHAVRGAERGSSAIYRYFTAGNDIPRGQDVLSEKPQLTYPSVLTSKSLWQLERRQICERTKIPPSGSDRGGGCGNGCILG